MQRMAPQGDKAQPNPATPEQEQRLRSLGYTAGSGGSKPLDDPPNELNWKYGSSNARLLFGDARPPT